MQLQKFGGGGADNCKWVKAGLITGITRIDAVYFHHLYSPKVALLVYTAKLAINSLQQQAAQVAQAEGWVASVEAPEADRLEMAAVAALATAATATVAAEGAEGAAWVASLQRGTSRSLTPSCC